MAVPILLLASLGAGAGGAWGQQPVPTAREMADQTMQRWPEGRFIEPGASWHWNYQLGLLLQGMDAVWKQTGDEKYLKYTQHAIDPLVAPDGSIPTYDARDNSLDNILLGRPLLLLYRETKDERYRKAATLLRRQLTVQPRNPAGGFWHTQSNPDQMLLDDVYMVAPFYAEYAATFGEPQDFAVITRQFVLLEDHVRDPKSGLLYQEWNQTRKEPWVNKTTGASASFWGRGTGWYLMALVDTLPYYSKDDSGRAKLLEILNRTAEGVAAHQDEKTGLWYQVLDKPGQKGNYLESSASGMFIYALAKGARLGYLPPHYKDTAERGWKGMLHELVRREKNGTLTVTGTVKGIDLGSAPSHDGSYAYYTSAPVVSNDPKGIGAFLLAGTEMEKRKTTEGKHAPQ